METHSYSNNPASRADDGERPLPYALSRGALRLWLRRGEQLGRAAIWIAARVAAGHKRIARWGRQAKRGAAIKTPPHPG